MKNIINKLIKKVFKTLAVFVALVFFVNIFLTTVQAVTEVPSFPSCESKIFTSKGDKAHYDYGIHGIVGLGNFAGRDDVYSLGNNNYLQCFCPVEGTTGIQSNWWSVRGMGSDEIKNFRSQGWFYEISGLLWNLPDDPYLIKNSNFSCVQPSVTPIVSVTPQPTVTAVPGPESKCYQLEASVKEGTAPLTVKFTAHADDPATNGKIKEYKFFFADASGGQPDTWSQTDPVAYHRYEKDGTFTASLNVKDNAGNWRGSEECRVTIKVNSHPQVLAASTSSELPATGLPSTVAISVAAFGSLGYFLYRKFRLV